MHFESPIKSNHGHAYSVFLPLINGHSCAVFAVSFSCSFVVVADVRKMLWRCGWGSHEENLRGC